MNLGAPVLLSGKPLLRIGAAKSCDERYDEALLQELIHNQPSVLPICDFCPQGESVL
jgi:hypothetical protein